MVSFKKILFPTDFTEGAQHALLHAIRLADVHKGEIIVQHVVRNYFERHAHWTTLFDVRDMQKHLDMYIDSKMAGLIPERDRARIKIRPQISEGNPAHQIVELAAKEQVDLIVMGPAKGAVTGAVIRAAGRPVLAIPNNPNSERSLGRISRILVATDLSPQSRKVIDYAVELKRLFDCEVFLLHAIELTETIRFGIQQGHFTNAPLKFRTWATNQLENLTPHEFVKDPTVHRLIEEGPAGERIPLCAAAHSVDMVILGTHGYGPIQQHFLGSTAEKVLKKLGEPVLTVRI